MSVVRGKRGVTKLKVIDEAEKLANYTINIVSNEQHFPKRYRWVYSGKITDAALRVNSLVHEANSFAPKDKAEMRIRIKFIIEAIASIADLHSLVSLARQQKDVDLTNLEYWLNSTTYVKTLLLKWRETSRKALLDLPD